MAKSYENDDQKKALMDVLFFRVHATVAEAITVGLSSLYADGWRVVSHADNDGDYTFVLERPSAS